MKKYLALLLGAATLTLGLSGCVVAPAYGPYGYAPGYYGGYYAPGYVVAPTVEIGGGWRGGGGRGGR